MSDIYGIAGKPSAYDVIFLGQLGSVIASLFANANKIHRYKCLVINKKKQVFQPALLPTHWPIVDLKKLSINGFNVSFENVSELKPFEHQIRTDSKIIFKYRYLVYGMGSEEWGDFNFIQNLNEALDTKYSMAYSNLKKPFQKSTLCPIQNAIFYVPDQPHGGYDNYNFLYLLKILKSKAKRQNLNVQVILEGKSFYPFSQQAHKILEQNLVQNGFKVIKRTKIQKIDYLRRILFPENKKCSIPYDFFYVFIPHKTPQIMTKAGINPFQNCSKTLVNKIHKNIFVIGADIYPTTHSYRAINYQVHILTKNIENMLRNREFMAEYKGETQFPIWTNQKNFLNWTHEYTSQQRNNQSMGCLCGAMLTRNLFLGLQIKLYYNLQLSGAPYYLFSPQIESNLSYENRIDRERKFTKRK